MRQARLCSNCLTRVSCLVADDKSQGIFGDIKELMNLLSVSSRWNKDIFEDIIAKPVTLNKKKPKSEKGINVIIVSSGDHNKKGNYYWTLWREN